jgi:transcriptional regulator with XRE-family HTH domain
MAKRPDRQPDALAVERDWSRRIATTVGAQVKRLREQRDSRMSAKQLADTCEQLGYRVEQQVIANMENGRRTSVTIPDVMVLARALGVPPIELVFPLGHDEQTEVLPGEVIDTWQAVTWFTAENGGKPTTAVVLFRSYGRYLDRLRGLRMDAGAARRSAELAASDGEQQAHLLRAGAAEDSAREVERWIVENRAYMRGLGYTPPALPPDLAHLDGEAQSDTTAG